jgi:hypothetical protein
VSVWRTHAPIEDAFREEWNRRVSGAPHSNFTLDLRYLAHEAAGGKHSWAVLAEEGERSAAFVLRESNGELVSGWPWRWQAVLAGRPAHLPSPFEPGDSAWLHGIARAVGHGKRLRMFLPAAAESSISCYPAGATVLQPLERADDEILASMNSSKRRMVRKARDLSYAISEAGDDDSFRAFAELQRLTAERRGYRVIDAAPDAWREWSLPWMWLLVARRDGRIVSGAGDGIFQGGTVEGRAGASTAQARRDGAFALVCFEEVRRARDRGHRWLNHCGDTAFKREIAGRLGVRVPIWCWMVGGALAGAQDHVEAAWKTLRPRAAALFRSRGPMQTGLPLALGFALESALREGPSWLS